MAERGSLAVLYITNTQVEQSKGNYRLIEVNRNNQYATPYQVRSPRALLALHQEKIATICHDVEKPVSGDRYHNPGRKTNHKQSGGQQASERQDIKIHEIMSRRVGRFCPEVVERQQPQRNDKRANQLLDEGMNARVIWREFVVPD
jgi:hypothetical protein